MPDVVVGAPLGLPGLHRQRLLGPVQRLDLGLLVDAEHDRVLRRVQVQPDHVGDLGDQLRVGGELERLRPPRLHPVMPPGPQHRRGVHPQVVGEQPRRPVRDPQLRRRRGQRRGQDLGPIHRPRPTRPPLIVQTPACPRRRSAPASEITVCRATPTRSAISVFDTPSAASSTIRARCARPARIDDDRVQDSNNSRSPGRRPIGCARIPHSRAPTLSNYFRRAALDLVDIIRWKSGSGVQVRMHVGDPDSPAVQTRAQEERVNWLPERCRTMARYLAGVADVSGATVRVHGTTLYASIFRFDELILVNQHAYGSWACHSPVFEVVRSAGTHLFDHYSSAYERVWAISQPA